MSVGRVLAVFVSSLAVLSFLLLAAHGAHAVLHAPLLFFAVPLILCGVVFELRGGLVAAAVACALIAYGSHATPIGLAAFAVVLVLLGSGSALFARERRSTIADVGRCDAFSLDLIAMITRDGSLRSVNPAFTSVLGYTAAELLGSKLTDFMHPDDSARTLTALEEQAKTSRDVLGLLNRFRTRDGTDRWLEWNIRFDEGSGTLIAFARDVTDRVEAEQREKLKSRELERALEEAREVGERLDLVAEAVADGLVTIDASGTIVRFNAAAERMFGCQRSEVIGRHEDMLVADPGQATLVDRYLRTGEEGIIGARHETVCRRKDGSVFPVEFTLGVISEASEPLFVTVFRDISERRQHEEAERNFKDILQRTVRERTEDLRARTVELDDARVETLRKLALAAEYRDDQTYAHAERVGNTAALLGGLLGLTDRETALIRQAAPLHDIGKLAVSDAILLTSEKLTPAQWDQMRSHTTVGHEILSSSVSEVLSLAAEIALTHHEWWSGSGYPVGLIGEQIPLCGRLVALADVFDSLCHERPYKAAWTVEDAEAEIHRLSGRQFDPAVVDAFAQLDPYVLAGNPPPTRRGRVASPRTVRTRSRHSVGPAAGGNGAWGRESSSDVAWGVPSA